jgi:hypothetical protein
VKVSLLVVESPLAANWKGEGAERSNRFDSPAAGNVLINASTPSEIKVVTILMKISLLP